MACSSLGEKVLVPQLRSVPKRCMGSQSHSLKSNLQMLQDFSHPISKPSSVSLRRDNQFFLIIKGPKKRTGQQKAGVS